MPTTRRIVPFALICMVLATSVLAFAQSPLGFVPVTPCRVVDTRWANGPLGGPSISAIGSRDFIIPTRRAAGFPHCRSVFAERDCGSPPDTGIPDGVAYWTRRGPCCPP